MKRDIQFLYELGTFRYLDRIWKQFSNPDVANNAEHTLRVIWIALSLAKHEKNVNQEKVIKMAMLHDIPELRCGDVHYISRQYVERKEDEAVKDIFEDTIQAKEMIELFHEYEERKSIEAKIVKDADNLDVEFEIMEMKAKGHSLGTLLNPHRQKFVFPKLFTKTAKKFWKQIHKTSPHDWHYLSPKNRFNGGDWKKKKIILTAGQKSFLKKDRKIASIW